MGTLLSQGNPSVSVPFLHCFILGNPASGGHQFAEVICGHTCSSFLMDIKLISCLHRLPPSPTPKAPWRRKEKFSPLLVMCFPQCQTPSLTDVSPCEMTGYLRAVLEPD